MDQDSSSSKNSEIRYEIINGNYERKFSIDELTGVISVTEPLNLNFVRQRGKENNGLKKKRKRNLRKSKAAGAARTARQGFRDSGSSDNLSLIHI